MLILILIDVQYSQKAVFSFEKGLNLQNRSSSGSLHLVKKFPPAKFLIPVPPLGGIYPPHPLLLFGKPCSIRVLLFWQQAQQSQLKPSFLFVLVNPAKLGKAGSRG